MRRTIIILGILILSFLPLAFYFSHFRYGISNDISDWAAFGSYVGGIYGALAFIAVAYSIYVTRIQFASQHEDNVFYRSIESLQTRIKVNSSESYQSPIEVSVAKAAVLAFIEDLRRQSPHMGRKVLCNNPELISRTNMVKILTATNATFQFMVNPLSQEGLLKEIEARDDFVEKWEYLKSVFGGLDHEGREVRQALQDAGSVSFYKTGFSHRQYYYGIAWQAADLHLGEEINLYLRKMDFIISYIDQSMSKIPYRKFLLSQLSKYDITFMFFYALASDDVNVVKLFLDSGVIDQIRRFECRSMLFDSPSEEEVTSELEMIRKKVNKLLKADGASAAV